MNEGILIKNILKFVNRNYKDINIINVEEDQVLYLKFNDNNELVIINRGTYTDYINEMTNRIHPEDINNYFANLSVTKLENLSARGEDELKCKFRYRCETGAFRWYLNVVKFYELEGKKYIFTLFEDVEDRLLAEELKSTKLESEVNSYKQKLVSESESMANALYQVNNILDSGNGNGVFQISNTRNYINTVFSNASLEHPELNQALTSKLSEVSNYTKPSLLIVDDSSIIRNSLKRIFQVDFNIIMATNGDEAIKIIQDNVINSEMTNKHENIVGMLLDLIMPQSDGFTVLKFMKNFNLLKKIPVAIISGDETKETRKKVYEYEIVDMLEKPFNTDTIRRRIGKIINLYMSSNNLQNIVAIQGEKISNDTGLSDEYRVIINKVVDNIVNNSESVRLKKIVKALGVCLANHYPNYNVTTESLTTIVNTCPLYNIGSIAIRNNIQFTTSTIKEEIDYAKTIIDSYVKEEEKSIALNIAKYSCELFNGKGHPNKMSGNEIPIEAQLVSLAVRILKSEKTIQASIKKIMDQEKSKYNPDLIKVLDMVKKDIKSI